MKKKLTCFLGIAAIPAMCQNASAQKAPAQPKISDANMVKLLKAEVLQLKLQLQQDEDKLNMVNQFIFSKVYGDRVEQIKQDGSAAQALAQMDCDPTGSGKAAVQETAQGSGEFFCRVLGNAAPSK